MGEEAEGAGKSDLAIDDEQYVVGTPFDDVLWFTLFKIILDKFEQELKWFRENKQTLEMMVKEYIEAGEHR